MFPVKQILDNIVNSYTAVLKENLVGIYLHGSLAMNCFNPDSSDIDFLVIVKEKPAFDDMRALIDILLNLSGNGPEKGFEMSVLLEYDAKNFRYPTPFVLHYSNLYKDKYINNPEFICGGSEDADLAAHITVLRHRGICLAGKPISEVFQPVPRKYYIKSIMDDISSSKEGIADNPVYYILNLCRVLCFLKDGKVCSKKEGGEWAESNFSSDYREIVEAALNAYDDIHRKFDIRSERLADFADFMLKEIENLYYADYELLPITEQHVKTLYDWIKKENHMEYYTCRPLKLSDNYEEYAYRILNAVNEMKQKIYVLVNKEELNKPLSKITLFDFNPRNHSAEFGYYLPGNNRACGLGSIMLSKFIEICFTDYKLDLNKIYATTSSNNAASIKLLEKFEFRLDGRMREHYWIGENRYDQLVYSMLKEEKRQD